MPQVSICIPTYNMAQFVGLAVQSVVEQTYTDFEVVVCDNASTDDTTEVLRQFSDPRLKIYRNSENIGAVRNFNLLIERATGEWVKFLEADDLLDPTCLEVCMQMVQQDPEVDAVSVGRTRIYSDGTPFMREVHRTTEIVSGSVVRRRVHLRHNEFGTPTDVIVRRSLLEAVGGFDPEYGQYLNDWDLWLKCQERARKIAFVAQSLVHVRSHAGQIGAVGAKSNTDIDVLYQMVHKRWSGYTPTHCLWWQGQYMRLRLGIPYVYRGARQVVRNRMATGVSRWDALLRLHNHLGTAGLTAVLLVALVFWPFYPHLNKKVTNVEWLAVSDSNTSVHWHESPLFRGSVFALPLGAMAIIVWGLVRKSSIQPIKKA